MKARSVVCWRKSGPGNIQPWSRKPCAGEFRNSRIYLGCSGAGNASFARKRAPVGTGLPRLSGILKRNVRELARTAIGDDTLPAAQPLCVCQGIRVRHHSELQGKLWVACVKWHSFQPRIATPGRNLRHPQDNARRRSNRVGVTRQALPWESGCAPRLGFCARLCACHVAHAAARTPPTIT